MEDNNIISCDYEKFIEELKCPICFEIFNEPVMELPNQHILCKQCLLKSNQNNNNKLECPMCKTDIDYTIEPRFIMNLLNLIEMKCLSKFNGKECDWKGNAQSYFIHRKNCEIEKNKKKENLKSNCDKMREILEKEINPHLRNEHYEIYNQYVKDWLWLEEIKKDWKWWWWASNEWWKNKPCIKCNELWHKYEDEIEIYEKQRILSLNDLGTEN